MPCIDLWGSTCQSLYRKNSVLRSTVFLFIDLSVYRVAIGVINAARLLFLVCLQTFRLLLQLQKGRSRMLIRISTPTLPRSYLNGMQRKGTWRTLAVLKPKWGFDFEYFWIDTQIWGLAANCSWGGGGQAMQHTFYWKFINSVTVTNFQFWNLIDRSTVFYWTSESF